MKQKEGKGGKGNTRNKGGGYKGSGTRRRKIERQTGREGGEYHNAFAKGG